MARIPLFHNGACCRGRGWTCQQVLNDGALAVFGAPNDVADHADAALTAAVVIHRLVAERFGESYASASGSTPVW